MLDANGGSLFGVKLVPTTLLQALRPDALGFSPLSRGCLQGFKTPVIGDAVFNKLDFRRASPRRCRCSSSSASSGSSRSSGLGSPSRTMSPCSGCRSSAGSLQRVLPYAFTFVAIRYLGDWCPLLVIVASAGLQVVLPSGRVRLAGDGGTPRSSGSRSSAVRGVGELRARPPVAAPVRPPGAVPRTTPGLRSAQYRIAAAWGWARRTSSSRLACLAVRDARRMRRGSR